MKDDDKNILSHMKPDDYREFRNLVIEQVLSTDMSQHFSQLKTVRSMLKETRLVSFKILIRISVYKLHLSLIYVKGSFHNVFPYQV